MAEPTPIIEPWLVNVIMLFFLVVIPGLVMASYVLRRLGAHRRQSRSEESETPERRPFKMPNLPQASKLKILAAFITFIVIVVILAESVVIVQAGHRGILLNLGKVEGCDESGTCSPAKVLGEGMHFITPFAENVVQMEVRVLKYEASGEAASKDLQSVSTTITLNYHIDPSQANAIYQSLGEAYADKVIAPTIQESVKASTAKFDAEELITKRDTAKATIEDHIQKSLADRKIITDSVYITDFKFSDTFSAQIEAKVVAYQSYLTEQNKLKSVGVQAQQSVTQANGAANSTIAKARGDAEANIERAKGEAEAIKIINEELKRNPQYLQWAMIKQWNGQLPYAMGQGGFFPFIDITKLKNNGTG